MNEELVRNFRLLGVLYSLDNEPWRSKTYFKAAQIVEDYPSSILLGSEIRHLRGIGKGIEKDINDFLTSGKMPRLEDLKEKFRERLQTFKDLQRVFKIGPKKAQELYQKGVRSLRDLRNPKFWRLLTREQRLGFEYLEDIEERIPRKEIEDFEAGFGEIMEELGIERWSIVGSYRRGNPDSGDIDILIQKTPGVEMREVVDTLAELKIDTGESVLVDVLSEGLVKMMGLIQVSSEDPVRRLDLLIIDPEEWAPAVTYFTGSKEFNVEMRQRALDMGYTLNEHRLQDLETEEDVVLETEKDLFEFLGYEYIEPEDR